MKKSIGILYICTGPYKVFWKDFFDSFEKCFLPETEKKYYVFTDDKNIYMANECDRVKIILIEPQPWPLVTLLRFHKFLSIEEDIEKHDYIMFSNANMKCDTTVYESEFLPRVCKNEKLSFVHHPGYFREKSKSVPYDRNRHSLAYIPYNCGSSYIIGAMFAGDSKEFIRMSKTLRDRINEDLKKGIIAKWHDESHLNRYIIGKDNYRLLPPSYCYPVGFDLEFDKKISGVSKQDKFDVNSFKGFYDKKNKSSILLRTKETLKCVIKKENVMFPIDAILMRSIDVI